MGCGGRRAEGAAGGTAEYAKYAEGLKGPALNSQLRRQRLEAVWLLFGWTVTVLSLRTSDFGIDSGFAFWGSDFIPVGGIGWQIFFPSG